MKQFRKLLLIPFLAVGLLLPRAVQAQPMESHKYQTASDVIDEVNALRTEQGLPPYQVNPILMRIAQSHADYQASKGIVTHYGENGSRPYQRALDAGYPVDGDLSTGGFFSENVDAGRNLSAFVVVQGWQEDALHLNTMISAELEDIGVGVAIADGVTYYTLVAGRASETAMSLPPRPHPLVGTHLHPVRAHRPHFSLWRPIRLQTMASFITLCSRTRRSGALRWLMKPPLPN